MAARLFRGVIIGPTGSGKTTISQKMAETFKIHHISSGDILRKHIVNSTHLGKLVNNYLAEGSLVPDKIIHSCLVDEIKKSGNRFILDGYPRTITQAHTLSEHTEIDTCIFLNVPFHVIIKRLSTRLTHLPSGRVYNYGYKNPKVRNKDDETGEPLSKREDDSPSGVIKRLEVYENTTIPIIGYYRDKNILHEFDGKTSNEIWLHVRELLEHKLN